MTATPHGPPDERTIRLLDHDPELGASLRPERLEEARRHAIVHTASVPRGTWDLARTGAAPGMTPYGLLVLDGLATHTVRLAGVRASQLLGRGDLILPPGGREDALIQTDVEWIALEPLTVALLDERFLHAIRRWPELVATLFERVAARFERLRAHQAVSQLPRVEDRVHAQLWLLAERWGRMTPDGVVVPVRLTHELIGQLVGAKRPTVSLALKQLEQRGTVRRRDDGSWLLERAWSPQGELPLVAEEDDPGRSARFLGAEQVAAAQARPRTLTVTGAALRGRPGPRADAVRGGAAARR